VNTVLYYCIYSKVVKNEVSKEYMYTCYLNVGNPNGVPEVSHVVSNVAETDTVGNPSGVPGKSHVCSNSDETVSRSATVSFALDSLSDGVSSVQFTPPSTISPQVESCSLG